MERVPHLSPRGFSSPTQIKQWEVAYLGGDEDVLPRNTALPDSLSNLSLILCADVSVGVYLAESLKYVRRKSTRRQCDGNRQLEQP